MGKDVIDLNAYSVVDFRHKALTALRKVRVKTKELVPRFDARCRPRPAPVGTDHSGRPVE